MSLRREQGSEAVTEEAPFCERTKHGREPQGIFTKQSMPYHAQTKLPTGLIRMRNILGAEKAYGPGRVHYKADRPLTWVSA